MLIQKALSRYDGNVSRPRRRSACRGAPCTGASPAMAYEPPLTASGASHERRVFLLTLLAGSPAVVATLILLWRGGYSGKCSGPSASSSSRAG
jgi:hypothetical protein